MTIMYNNDIAKQPQHQPPTEQQKQQKLQRTLSTKRTTTHRKAISINHQQQTTKQHIINMHTINITIPQEAICG